jgi:hypothetical protein
MAHLSATKGNQPTSSNTDAIYAGVHQAIKASDQKKLMTSLQEMGALKGLHNAQRLVDELLPNTVAQIDRILLERFSRNQHRTPTQTNRIWKSLTTKRQLYSTVVTAINNHADRNNISIPENLAVQSHLPLLVGPIKFVQPLKSELKLLDGMLSFTERFNEYEKGRIKEITKGLIEIGVANLLKGRGDRGGVSAQRICDVVMESYGFAPVPVRVSTKNEENTSYSPSSREIIIKEEGFKDLTDELKINVVLHEARHAVQIHIIDNMLWGRRDGSPNLYRHNRTHEVVRDFPRDVERMLISLFARSISSELVVLSNSAIQALYAAQSSEKDADRFAAHILATLTKRDSDSITDDYRSLLNREASSSSDKKVQSITAHEFEAVTSSLVLPSRENAWGASSIRDAILETFDKSQPKPEVKDPFEHLLIGKRDDAQTEKGEKGRSAAVERDSEHYTRFAKSLAYQVIVANQTSIAAVRREFPKLQALAAKPFCGENGLRRFVAWIDEALTGPLPLDSALRKRLENTAKEIRNKLEEEFPSSNNNSKEDEKSKALATLTSGVKAQIPNDDKGKQVSLLDTCAQLNAFFLRKNYAAMAHELQVVFAHVEQGWLGVPAKQFASRFLGEVKSNLNQIQDAELRKATSVQLTKAIKALDKR